MLLAGIRFHTVNETAGRIWKRVPNLVISLFNCANLGRECSVNFVPSVPIIWPPCWGEPIPLSHKSRRRLLLLLLLLLL